MTGSLQIKNNKFYMVLNTYENGKRKNKWICTDLPVKGNKTKAQKMLRDTLRDYEQEEERRAREEIARATMPFVDAIKLQAYINEKAKSGRIDGKGGLAARSLKLLKNILNQTLLYCVSEGMIPNNPCQFVKLPASAGTA